eukprot:g4567.t1
MALITGGGTLQIQSHSTNVVCVEDVNAIVVDCGSGSIRVGYSGEDTPKTVYPSLVGKTVSNAESDPVPFRSGRFVGNASLGFRRDGMEVCWPFTGDGMYDDWEAINELWKHAFEDQLKLNMEEHPLLFCEPTRLTDSLREKLVENVFEMYSTPATFLAKNSVLSSFASGRQTSLVADCGYSGSTISAVYDGYLLKKSVRWSAIGGKLLTECMKRSVDPEGTRIRPRYEVKRSHSTQGTFTTKVLDFPLTHVSYRDYCINVIATDIKESICRVSDFVFTEGDNSNMPTVNYELPDGNEIHIGSDRFKIPEVLFQPDLLKTFGPVDQESRSIPSLIVDSIQSCDVDIRRELFNGIILTGGTAQFSQMRDRLEKELVDETTQVVKVKVITPVNSNERKFNAWIGGSILSSLGTFQQMWMSRAEYEEHGSSLIHRRAP